MSAAYCKQCARRVPWHLVGLLFGILFAFGGGMLGLFSYEASRASSDDRDALRAACVSGKENACRMYEVDYGR